MPGGFSGNGSVTWFVEVKQAKPNTKPGSGGKYRHEGKEDTDKDQRFGVTIQFPQDATERLAFRQQLYDAWSTSSNSSVTAVVLSIPVEDVGSGYTPPAKDQIVIDWDA
jgi:hypothetical protein